MLTVLQNKLERIKEPGAVVTIRDGLGDSVRNYLHDPQAARDVTLFCIGEVISIIDWYKVKNPISPKQAGEWVTMVFEKHPDLAPEDFVVFAKHCKRGTFGPCYERMDGARLFEWLDKYYAMVIRERENAARDQSNQLSKTWDIPGEVFQQHFGDIVKRFSEPAKTVDALPDKEVVISQDEELRGFERQCDLLSNAIPLLSGEKKQDLIDELKSRGDHRLAKWVEEFE